MLRGDRRREPRPGPLHFSNFGGMSNTSAMPRLTSKGQVTVPVAIRYALGLAPGDDVVFAVEDGRGVFRRATGLDDLRGGVPRVAPRRRALPRASARGRRRARSPTSCARVARAAHACACRTPCCSTSPARSRARVRLRTRSPERFATSWPIALSVSTTRQPSGQRSTSSPAAAMRCARTHSRVAEVPACVAVGRSAWTARLPKPVPEFDLTLLDPSTMDPSQIGRAQTSRVALQNRLEAKEYPCWI